MTSIKTNASAMTALRSLQQTNTQLESTQNRISTGFKVSTASDNAAYWSIATTMRSDNKALSTVQDALGLGSAKIDVTYTGLKSSIDVVDEIKSKLVAAREPGVDRSKIQDEIGQLQLQLKAIADSSTFSGQNWLSVNSDPTGDYVQVQSVVSSFTRTDTTVKVDTIAIDTATLKMFDPFDKSGILDTEYTGVAPSDPIIASVSTLNITLPGVSDDTIDQFVSFVDGQLAKMTTSASNIGAVQKRISGQQDFVSSLMDAIDRGVGALVDADMSKESTRLQALQTQQQLGVQSLSIANSSSQTILSLFQ